MAGKHFYYVFRFDSSDISRSRIVKTKSLEVAERIAREQPIYIEPSHNVSDVRAVALEWLRDHRDEYVEAIRYAAHTKSRLMEEVEA